MQKKFLLMGAVALVATGFLGYELQNHTGDDNHPALKGCTQEGNIITCPVTPGFEVIPPTEDSTVVKPKMKM